MRSTIAGAEHTLIKVDKEIEQEHKEIKRLEDGNLKLKEELTKNEEAGSRILAELAAIDDERNGNKNKLESFKANFNNLKKEIQ